MMRGGGRGNFQQHRGGGGGGRGGSFGRGGGFSAGRGGGGGGGSPSFGQQRGRGFASAGGGRGGGGFAQSQPPQQRFNNNNFQRGGFGGGGGSSRGGGGFSRGGGGGGGFSRGGGRGGGGRGSFGNHQAQRRPREFPSKRPEKEEEEEKPESLEAAIAKKFPVPKLYFKADPNDHFETSIDALADVYPAVAAVKRILQVRVNKHDKTKSSTPFILYDPYFCAGKIKQYWKELFGIEHVVNENRDFYADLGLVTYEYKPGPEESTNNDNDEKTKEQKEEDDDEDNKKENEDDEATASKKETEKKNEGTIIATNEITNKKPVRVRLPKIIETKEEIEIDLQDPDQFPFAGYSMIVTNPPFSLDHIPKLFKFLARSKKPYAVLFPDYVVTKKWFKDFYEETYGGRATAPSTKVTMSASTQSAVQLAMSSTTTGSLSSLFANHPAFGSSTKKTETTTTTTKKKEEEIQESDAARRARLGFGPSSGSFVMAPKTKQQQEEEEEAKKKLAASKFNPSTLLQEENTSAEPFFIFPKKEHNYEYDHPLKAGRGQSHFRSVWMVWVGGSMKGDVYREVQCPSEQLYSQTTTTTSTGDSKTRNMMSTSIDAEKKEGAAGASLPTPKAKPSECEIFFSLEKFLLRLQKFQTARENNNNSKTKHGDGDDDY